MRQTSHDPTRSINSLRIDHLALDRLSYIKAWYAAQGETISNSIIVRRALEVLEHQLSNLLREPKGTRNTEVNLLVEMSGVLACANNKKSWREDKPWLNPENKLKPFSSYRRAKLPWLHEE